MQWFQIPPRIFFEKGAIAYLAKMPNISRVFIVTDPTMVSLGYVERIQEQLRKRSKEVAIEIFSDVEPDPSTETVARGTAAMNRFKPDAIIALGGGSPIDAAKGMWLFYEHPDSKFEDMKLKFLDIRKRAYEFPALGEKAQFVAIPTTSGTGSEVTAFTVITDKKTGTKYPLADYVLTPTVAIVDPQFTETMPRSIVADTGMDVLTHAIEAYVAILNSDYTSALALQAIKMVFDYLPKSYNDGCLIAREKMHNASCIAGLAFTNAFLGINHSMAHKMGGEFHLPHGRANAILLPHVIEYNSAVADKHPAFPKYNTPKAKQQYAEIATHLGLGGKTEDEKVQKLIDAIRGLMKTLGIPATVRDCDISEKDFMAKVPALAKLAFQDQCTIANPRYPLIKDLEEIYKKAY